MKYTYRDEYFYNLREIAACIITVVIWLVFAIMAVIVSPPLIIVFLALAVICVWLSYKNAAKRYNKAMEHRHKMMTQGYQCIGKIVDAGGRIIHERETYYDNETHKREYINTKLPNYWIEVAYFDIRENRQKRCKSEKFGKKTHELIGKTVEVYVFIDQIYINIP